MKDADDTASRRLTLRVSRLLAMPATGMTNGIITLAQQPHMLLTYLQFKNLGYFCCHIASRQQPYRMGHDCQVKSPKATCMPYNSKHSAIHSPPNHTTAVASAQHSCLLASKPLGNLVLRPSAWHRYPQTPQN